jgi:hypothetical protein
MATQNILLETFNATVGGANHFTTAGTGHLDNAGWLGNVGTGSTLDADSTVITDALGGTSEILQVIKVSPNFNAQGQWDSGSARAVSYFHVYYQVTAEGLANTQIVLIARGRVPTTFNETWKIHLKQNAVGKVVIRYTVYNNGADSGTDSGTVSLNTWYRLEAYYDATSQLYEFRQDGVTISKGALTGTTYGGPRYFSLGDVGSSYTLTAYYDLCYVDSNGFQTASTRTPGIIMVM